MEDACRWCLTYSARSRASGSGVRRKGFVLGISGTTALVGIIGWPVAHSLSPALHNAAFAACGLNMAYVPLPVSSDRVSEAVTGLRALGFVGANVTIPHKTAVVPLLDEIDDEARLAGAVNTVVVRDERLAGYNTDVQGFARSLHDVYLGSLAGRTVLLLGAGGMARAVAVVLAREGALVTVADRTLPAAESIVRVMAQVSGSAPAKTLALAALSAETVREADVIVNASALGMASVGKVPAVLADNVRSDHVVCDVVYTEQPTQLVAQARARDALTVDGLSMLVWQAAASFELWTTQTAPVEVMRSAVTGQRGC